jgi:hypothetical protein
MILIFNYMYTMIKECSQLVLGMLLTGVLAMNLDVSSK